MNPAGFIRSMLSESDGTVSNTRVCIVVIVAFASGWITALVLKVPGPVHLPELQDFVGRVGEYVGGICGALYGVNKAGDVLNNRAKGPQQ